MVYSIEEVSPGDASMGNGGFQSGTLMVRILIADTRNYYGENDKRRKFAGKNIGIHRGERGRWAVQAEVVTARGCCEV